MLWLRGIPPQPVNCHHHLNLYERITLRFSVDATDIGGFDLVHFRKPIQNNTTRPGRQISKDHRSSRLEIQRPEQE